MTQDAPRLLDSGWEYRWGDSPFTADGRPLWTFGDADQDAWHAIDFPSNPPDREGRRNVWYRVPLPDGQWRDPVLYIYSVDLITEVYLDGQKIYHYGTFDGLGQGRFAGWPWHMIHLPEGFAGKRLYFRIYSSYSDIGLWGEVMVMERLELFRHILSNSTEQVIVSGVSLVIALMALVFAAVQAERRTYLLIFAFSLASAVMLFSQAQVKQFLFNVPLVWDYIGAAAYFSLPITMALLFRAWINGPFRWLINAICHVHIMFLLVAIGGSIAGVFELSTIYLYFDGLLTLTLVILFAIAFLRFKAVHSEIRAVIVTFAVFSLFLLIDMAVARGLLPWTRMPLSWGILLFSLAMIAIALRHFARTQQALKELNATLEQKVLERTIDLEQLAAADPLTGLMNRRSFYDEAERIFQSAKRYKRDLAVLMVDIDHFKAFNDTYGHALGDDILIKVAQCLRNACRETDLLARFGGEEFVIVLQEADTHAAFKTAERVRNAITTIELPKVDRTVTASLGVSQLQTDTESLEMLLLRADMALYKAKDAGRNITQVG